MSSPQLAAWRWSHRQFVTPGVLAALLIVVLVACSAPRYDQQIDELISKAQQSANDEISELIVLDRLIQRLRSSTSPTDRADADKATQQASYEQAIPFYNSIDLSLTQIEARMGARGTQSNPQILQVVGGLRALLVGPEETSMQSIHREHNRIGEDRLRTLRPQVIAGFNGLAIYEASLKDTAKKP